MFQCSQQIGVVCSRELHCIWPVSISKHRKVYCEVICIRGRYIAQRIRYLTINNDVGKVVDSFFGFVLFFSEDRNSFFCILSEITTFRKSSLFFCFWLCFLFRRTENNFCFLHFIRNNDFPNVVVIFGFALFFWRTGNLFFLALLVSIDHSHSTSRHKPSQKFNMCDFVASSQALVAKAVIACDHWYPYILRRRALLCVLLTHVWKPGFRG